MKFVLGLVAALGIIFIFNSERAKEPVVNTLAKTNVALTEVVAGPAIGAVNEMHQRAINRAETAKIEARNAEKVKIYVAGRDAKTCMEILKTTVINNKVIECNKDRTVEMRRDEIEAFKIEQRIE